MRALSLLVLVAGCSSSASSTTPDATTTPPDGAVGLSCGITMAAYCNANSCEDLAAAKQDKTLCPASLKTCGEFEVITKGGVDTATQYFYQGDQLVAIDHTVLPGPHTCTAGPATFIEPSCGTTTGQTLPACGP
jgi:hypothetical protein